MKPIESFKFEGNNSEIGLCVHEAESHAIQDNHCILTSLPKSGLENWSFVAVFDGHGCMSSVSDYLAKELINSILDADKQLFDELAQNSIIENQKEINKRIESAIKKGFLETDSTDSRMMKKINLVAYDPIEDRETDFPGSTAVACLISPTHVYIMNCGDSRAILVSDNQIKIVTLDHKPNNPLEKERIENAGGRIWVKENRIYGKKNINLSRSFGDYQFKVNFDLDPFSK